MTQRNLDCLFDPKSIALVGASRDKGSIGDVVARNLLSGGFDGPVMPVNPHATSIVSTLAYPDVESLPVCPDLAVISTPPQVIPGLIEDLGQRGTRAAIVITAGFGELGAQGRKLQQDMLNAARPNLLRIVGPNCLGVIVPKRGINASFAPSLPRPGNIAFVSQSGALLTSVLDWAEDREIGFSYVVSMGGMADVDFADMIDYLAQDRTTQSIILYVEAIRDARKFMSAARAAARVKPVVVVKAGRYEAGAKAAASHTGAMTGSDVVYDAAIRRAGMLRVTGLDDLFAAVETLAKRQRIYGDRLAILTNGGGAGVLATDWLMDVGGRLAELSPETRESLNAVLPATWSKGNPIDIIGDATGERYAQALSAVVKDPNTDAILVMNCPTAIADSVEAARAILPVARAQNRQGKPLLTNWLGEHRAEAARDVFSKNGVPTYETPELAVKAFMHRVEYERNQELLRRVPSAWDGPPSEARDKCQKIVKRALSQEREWLTEVEAKEVLSAYGIPIAQTVSVTGPDEAATVADRIGFPVALKILSPDITHKSDVGGVALNLNSADGVRIAATDMLSRVRDKARDAKIDGFSVQEMVLRPGAHELIVGIADDATFGPVILFGHGGKAVEIMQDRAVALPPLDSVLVDDLISRTRISRLLKGYRDEPAINFTELTDVILSVSSIAADLGDVCELDINPLFADEAGAIALDARIRLRKANVPGAQRFAIAPYPGKLEAEITDGSGKPYAVRPVKPQDDKIVRDMMARCQPRDLYMRFFSPYKDLPDKLAARLTQIDYDREMAFVALMQTDGKTQMAGGVRLVADPDWRRGEFSIIVRSDLKRTGIGSALMDHIIEYARHKGMSEVFGHVLRENKSMLSLCEKLGFHRKQDGVDTDATVVTLKLR